MLQRRLLLLLVMVLMVVASCMSLVSNDPFIHYTP